MELSRLVIVIPFFAAFEGVQGEVFCAQRPQVTAVAQGTSTRVTIDNSIGVKLVLIPAGQFTMGNNNSVEDEQAAFGKPYGLTPFPKRWYTDQSPPHRVRISRSFYLGMYEITVGQYRHFIQETGYKLDATSGSTRGGIGWDSAVDSFRFNSSFTWQHTGFLQTDRHPVVNVSWRDAAAFCGWLSTKERATYRLPTEAEWEYACRSGTTTRYCNGDDPEKLPDVGNVNDAAAKTRFSGFTHGIRNSDGYVFTAPVGRFRSNMFGLFDMHGNVAEWCSDWYANGYYTGSPPDDPTGPSSGEYRVQRGGSWFDMSMVAASAFRVMRKPDDRSFHCGFRIVKENGDKKGSRTTSGSTRSRSQ